MTQSLYERLGGRQTLHTLIDLFYYKVLLDPSLKKKFVDIDMISLKEHQLEFMTFVFGGGNKHYPVENLKTAHKGLNITEEQFQSVCRHLDSSMDELQVSPPLRTEVMEIVGDTHDMIVNA